MGGRRSRGVGTRVTPESSQTRSDLGEDLAGRRERHPSLLL